MKFSIISLNIGRLGVLKHGGREVSSGYNKVAVESASLSKTGFVGDEQADLKNHGGLDKAVCVYSAHNFAHFEKVLNRNLPIPAFGENFTVDSADETLLFIGDIFQCAEVRLQISQPRQPCFKTGAFHGDNSVIKIMSDTGATGFYFRVLSEGAVCQGNEFTRVESDGKYSLTYANDIMYRRNKDLDEIAEFIKHPFLSTAWKNELGNRLKKSI